MTGEEPEETILDVGETRDPTLIHSNYLEAWYSHREKITASEKRLMLAGLSKDVPPHIHGLDGATVALCSRRHD
jgi:hypothetical protein